METKLEPLGGGVKILVSDQYRFGTDGVLLSHFASPKKKDIAVDLGTGGGIIPLLWCKGNAPERITGLDIQEDACVMAARSAEISGVSDRLKIICGDMREIKTLFPAGCASLVTCNPPYRTAGGGIVNPDSARAIARHELTCGLSDAVSAAAWLLNSGGRFCLCQRPERLCDVMSEMRAARLEPKRLRLVCQRESTEPWLFLIEGKKDAASGMRIMPTLYIEKDGVSSPEMEEIYGDYRTGACGKGENTNG